MGCDGEATSNPGDDHQVGAPLPPHGHRWARVCRGDELLERGRAYRFEIGSGPQRLAAFVIRFESSVHAYINQCGHVPVELDWNPGEVFDSERLYLVCATHGALYHPATGACAGGPCRGRGLRRLTAMEWGAEIRVAVPLDESNNGRDE